MQEKDRPSRIHGPKPDTSIQPQEPPSIEVLLQGNRFELGSLIVTPEALRALQRFGIDGTSLLFRHAACDWGDLDPLDQRINERALQTGDRLVSCYLLRSPIGAHPRREALWIVTEANRMFTTLLLQDECWREQPYVQATK